jgi:hypothetical protein
LKKSKNEKIDLVSIAAIFVTISSLCASVSWISSSKAGGEADDLKTAALGYMILRLESSTKSSNELIQAQTYLTQAGMYFAEADSEDNIEIKSYLIELGNRSINMSNFHASESLDTENRSQNYFTNYSLTLDKANYYGNIASLRSTGALIFTISAIIASIVGIFKRKEIMYVYFPIFILAIANLAISLI